MSTQPEALRLADYLDGAQRYINGLQPDNPPRSYEQAAAELLRLHEVNQVLLEALKGIMRYGFDTLSGRDDGEDDRDWQRAAVREMTLRAKRAVAKATGDQQ